MESSINPSPIKRKPKKSIKPACVSKESFDLKFLLQPFDHWIQFQYKHEQHLILLCQEWDKRVQHEFKTIEHLMALSSELQSSLWLKIRESFAQAEKKQWISTFFNTSLSDDVFLLHSFQKHASSGLIVQWRLNVPTS